MADTTVRITIFAAGLLVGGGATYLIANKHFEKKYRDLAEEEIAAVRAAYEEVAKSEEEKKPKSPKEKVDQAFADLEEAQLEQTMEELDAKFARETPPTDEELEEAARLAAKYDESGQYGHHPDRDYTLRDDVEDPTQWDRSREIPYVITVDEFMMDNREWDKISLTYYSDDDTLADEDDQGVPDVDACIHVPNLAHFGVGSNDPDVMHIRNELKEVDFEVTRVEGSYSKIVMGIDKWDAADIEEPKPKIRKMKDHD